MQKSKLKLQRVTFKMTGHPYHGGDGDGEVCMVQGFINGNKDPVGVAHVTLYGDMNDANGYAYLEFIRVHPPWRRRGIATQLIHACQSRWNDFVLSDACSKTGEAFLTTLDSDGLLPDTTPYGRGFTGDVQ